MTAARGADSTTPANTGTPTDSGSASDSGTGIDAGITECFPIALDDTPLAIPTTFDDATPS